MYGNIFVWGILMAMLIKAIMKKVKLSYIIDDKFQKSITGFLVDYLMLSALMAISLQVISDGIVPVLLTVVIVGSLTFFIVKYFAIRSDRFQYERFMCEFGIVTGTAATGMLLLRSVDPQFRTPVIHELAWWNILMMFTAIHVFLSQAGMPVTTFTVWYFIMIGMIVIFLVIMKLTKLWSFKKQID
jgi:ESS family glutamate:Na+ symporter